MHILCHISKSKIEFKNEIIKAHEKFIKSVAWFHTPKICLESFEQSTKSDENLVRLNDSPLINIKHQVHMTLVKSILPQIKTIGFEDNNFPYYQQVN